MEKFSIDAKDRSVGNVASEVASILRGKKSASYAPHIIADVKVEVTNVTGIRITGKKMVQKKFTRYTGYPGGLIQKSMKDVIAKKGHKEVLIEAVKGMLPRNRHKSELMKKLTIKD